jgi:hypothetical protein
VVSRGQGNAIWQDFLKKGVCLVEKRPHILKENLTRLNRAEVSIYITTTKIMYITKEIMGVGVGYNMRACVNSTPDLLARLSP